MRCVLEHPPPGCLRRLVVLFEEEVALGGVGC